MPKKSVGNEKSSGAKNVNLKEGRGGGGRRRRGRSWHRLLRNADVLRPVGKQGEGEREEEPTDGCVWLPRHP